jgi:hypothetical protein
MTYSFSSLLTLLNTSKDDIQGVVSIVISSMADGHVVKGPTWRVVHKGSLLLTIKLLMYMLFI